MLGGNRIELTYKDRDHWKDTSHADLKTEQAPAPVAASGPK
jgi:hypothetical protein